MYLRVLWQVALMFVVCGADRLENVYLPPERAQTAGGSGFLAPPSSYVPPPSGLPSPAYNAKTYSGHAAPVAILRYNNENAGEGRYRFDYETENHISQQESGEVRRNPGTQHESSVVQGSYSYSGPDGVTYTVSYIADENGFRASGDHLPTPPPPPAVSSPEINRSGYSNAANSFTASDLSRQYLPSRGYTF